MFFELLNNVRFKILENVLGMFYKRYITTTPVSN